MTRTQIQLPDPLYARLKRVAREHDWSLAEVIRRASELYVDRFPDRPQKVAWKFPSPVDLGGPFLSAPENVRVEADSIEERNR
jgi:hypothetical protein